MQTRRRLIVLVLLVLPAVAPFAATPATTHAVTLWIWHYEPALAPETLPIYEALLEAIPVEIPILMAVRSADEADRVREVLDPQRISFVVISDKVSAWARDRYIPFRRDGQRFVLVPDEKGVAPGRLGDVAVAYRLADLRNGVQLVKSPLDIEGGDVVVTDEHVLVGAGTILDNLPRFLWSRDLVVDEIARTFGREVVVVGDIDSELPHDHLDMYVAPAGPRHVVVGDPGLTLPYFEARYDLGVYGSQVADLGTFTRERQEEAQPIYDRVAAQLAARGFHVTRMPVLHGEDGEMLTWTNVVPDRRAGRSRVYVPDYGVPYLDRLARKTWRELGYETFPAPSAAIIRHGGAVRCVTNVLD
jgi:N-dimethylarginine dimethylaminohydrolase